VANELGPKAHTLAPMEGVEVHTQKLLQLNMQGQEAVKEFALHDIDDTEGLELKRMAMHDAFTKLYTETANFTEELIGEDFDIAYLRERIARSEGETKEQLEAALKELQTQAQKNLADIWMARVLAWLHQAAAAMGPFIEKEHEDKKDSAAQYLASAITMLEKSFSATPSRTDGTLKLRRVALGALAYSLLSKSKKTPVSRLSEISGKNKIAEAEFYDEFLNELIGLESTFRQAFNPFDELIWRDILSSFIFEQATDLYNEALADLEKGTPDKDRAAQIKNWKQNTAGLSEVYLAMTYTDIADAQMRAGNLEDASKLYQQSSEAFGRAENLFLGLAALQGNAEQSGSDKDQKKAQSLFCKAEASVKELSGLLKVDNKEEASTVLKEIFKDLRKAEKLSKTRELTGAIKENLRILAFIEEKLKKDGQSMSGILDQIDLAKGIRKEGLIQDVGKALDAAEEALGEKPAEALEATREGLNSLGILLSLEEEDDQVTQLRNRTLALLNNVKYVIQFQLSSQLQQGVKFIVSRILENLHAEEAASYYKVVNEKPRADELTDLGRLAMATAYAAEAQAFARQSEQWAFRTQIERAGAFQKLESDLAELAEDEQSQAIDKTVQSHESTITRIKHAVASFEAAANQLNSVQGVEIRKKNNVENQVKQLQGVVLKFRGDLARLEAAKNDFLAEMLSKKGEMTKARQYYSQASDLLREAMGNYTVAAQVFQQLGDQQAAESVSMKANAADMLARGSWDNGQRLDRDQEPLYKSEMDLAALYLASTGK